MPWFHRAEPTQGHHSPLAAPQAPPSAEDSLFRSLFDNTLEAVVITDDHGRVLEANAEACHLFGRTLERTSTKSPFLRTGGQRREQRSTRCSQVSRVMGSCLTRVLDG